MARNERDRKLTVLLTLEEVSRLEQLANDEARTTSDMIRALIKTAHVQRYGRDAKPLATAPSLRGIIKDLTGRAHYTAGNIASRAQIPLDAIVRGLRTLQRKGLVEHVAGDGANATWEPHEPTYDAMIEAAIAKGIELDAAIGGA